MVRKGENKVSNPTLAVRDTNRNARIRRMIIKGAEYLVLLLACFIALLPVYGRLLRRIDTSIVVEDNVAYIDFAKCKLCRKCVIECPTGAIHDVNFPVPRPTKEIKKEVNNG